MRSLQLSATRLENIMLRTFIKRHLGGSDGLMDAWSLAYLGTTSCLPGPEWTGVFHEPCQSTYCLILY